MSTQAPVVELAKQLEARRGQEAAEKNNRLCKKLAEKLALTKARTEEIKEELKVLEKRDAALSVDLHDMLMKGHEGGYPMTELRLNVKPVVTENVFKAGQVENEEVFRWLWTNRMENLIQQTVPWNVLSSAVKAWLADEDNPDELPPIFNRVEKKTVKFVGRGIRAFLAMRRAEAEDAAERKANGESNSSDQSVSTQADQ